MSKLQKIPDLGGSQLQLALNSECLSYLFVVVPIFAELHLKGWRKSL